MNKYLDIISLIESDFYQMNKRLSWHIKHREYDDMSYELFQLLENIELNKDENEIFQVVKNRIYIDLSAYLSHVYDFIILSSKNVKPVYSSYSNIYIDSIWNKRPLGNTFSINLEKNRYKKNILKNFYSIATNIVPNYFFKFLISSGNQLVTEFKKNIKYKYLRVLPLYNFSINLSKSNFSKNLSEKISTIIFLWIEKKYFKLSLDHKISTHFIIEVLLSRVTNDINNYNGFLDNSKNIITGTGNGYYNRLISTLAKKNGTKVWRFNHGGDRCFFNDDFFWNAEYFQTDTYVTYGKKWGQFSRKRAKMLNKDIHIIEQGSDYHKKIFNRYFEKKKNKLKKILYVQTAFVSEARQFPYSAIIDPVMYDWQKYLIETLQNLNYEVMYKIHPKGFFQKKNNLSSIAKYKSTKSMIESLEYSDTVILDSAGSAFVEALCAGKDIIYIDMNQRLFDKENFNEFNSVVKIVSTNFRNGIFYLNMEELLHALSTPHKNLKKQEQIVNDYWLKDTN